MAEPAIPLAEIDKSKIFFSEKKEKTWVVPATKQPGFVNYIEVYYGDRSRKRRLCFQLENVKSFSGVKPFAGDPKSHSMAITLTPEMEALIKDRIENVIFDYVFDHLTELGIKKKIGSKPVLEALWSGVYKAGEAKQATEQNPNPVGNWPPSMFIPVPMKKKGQNAFDIDSSICLIEDIHGNPIHFSNLAGKELPELVVEIEKVTLRDSKIKVSTRLRVVIVGDSAVPPVTTKRKLEQERSISSSSSSSSSSEIPLASAYAKPAPVSVEVPQKPVEPVPPTPGAESAPPAAKRAKPN